MITTTRNTMIASAIGLLMLGGVATAALAANEPAAAAAKSGIEPSVLVKNQKLEGGKVHVEYAYLPAKGYILFYGADKDGKRTGEPIGHMALKAGDHREFQVELKQEPAAGSAVWASLYSDADSKQGFDRGGDKPFWSTLPYENKFMIQ